jgi:hypothetical protein
MSGYDRATFLKPGISRKLDVIYYLRRSDGAVKIGWSRDLRQRVGQLERAHGPLTLLAWEPGDRPAEQRRHVEFRADRIDRRYEWFRSSPALMDHVEQIGNELVEATELWGERLRLVLA